MDKVDVWMKVVGQKRLDEYKLSKSIEKLMNMFSEVKESMEKENLVDSINYIMNLEIWDMYMMRSYTNGLRVYSRHLYE